jgi:hypothetical protein
MSRLCALVVAAAALLFTQAAAGDQVIKTIPVGREPAFAVSAPDGTHVCVAVVTGDPRRDIYPGHIENAQVMRCRVRRHLVRRLHTRNCGFPTDAANFLHARACVAATRCGDAVRNWRFIEEIVTVLPLPCVTS